MVTFQHPDIAATSVVETSDLSQGVQSAVTSSHVTDTSTSEQMLVSISSSEQVAIATDPDLSHTLIEGGHSTGSVVPPSGTVELQSNDNVTHIEVCLEKLMTQFNKDNGK